MSFDVSKFDETAVKRLSTFAGIAATSSSEGERANAMSQFFRLLSKNNMSFQSLVEHALDPTNSINNDDLLETITDLDEANQAWEKMANDLQAAVEGLKKENEELKKNGSSQRSSFNNTNSNSAQFMDQTQELANAAKRISELETQLSSANNERDVVERRNQELHNSMQELGTDLAETKEALTKATLKPNQILQAMKAACIQLEEGVDPSHFVSPSSGANAFGLNSGIKDALSDYFNKKIAQADFLDEVENAFRMIVSMSQAAGLRSRMEVIGISPSNNQNSQGKPQTPIRLIKLTTSTPDGSQTKVISSVVNEGIGRRNGANHKGIMVKRDSGLFVSDASIVTMLDYLDFRGEKANCCNFRIEAFELYDSTKDMVMAILPHSLEMIYGQDQQKIRPVLNMLRTTFNI